MKKKFNKKIFLKEIKEIRNPPLNVTSTDSYLFEHEYQINQPALYIYELTSVSILNHFIYSSETKEILNLNFQQPGKNQIFAYFPELINLEKYSLDKKINLLKNLILKKFNLVLKVIFIYLINDFIYKIRRLIVLLKSYLANGIDLDNGIWITDSWRWANYFHWLTDFLPKTILLNKKYPNSKFLLPKSFLRQAPFVLSSLDLLEINYEIINEKTIYNFQNLKVLNNYSITGNQRKSLLKELNKSLRKIINLDQKLAYINEMPNFLYITRKENKNNFSSSRFIENEVEIFPILKKFNIKTISCEDLSFHKQLEIFSSCNFLISIHGAGLTNMIFMRNGGSILELRHENDAGSNCYFSMASSLGLDYYYLCGASINNSNIYNANLYIDTYKFSKLLTDILNK